MKYKISMSETPKEALILKIRKEINNKYPELFNSFKIKISEKGLYNYFLKNNDICYFDIVKTAKSLYGHSIKFYKNLLDNKIIFYHENVKEIFILEF